MDINRSAHCLKKGLCHFYHDYTHTSEPQAGTDLLLTCGDQLESLHRFSNQNNDLLSSHLQRSNFLTLVRAILDAQVSPGHLSFSFLLLSDLGCLLTPEVK